jgi:hypothetical protein
MNLQVPPAGDEAAAEAHVISSLRAPLGHMMLAAVRAAQPEGGATCGRAAGSVGGGPRQPRPRADR